LLTMPFIKLFASLEGQDLDVDPTGSVGTIHMTIFSGKIGQVRVTQESGTNNFLAYAKGDVEIKRGTQVLLIDHDEEKKAYLVEPYNHS